LGVFLARKRGNMGAMSLKNFNEESEKPKFIYRPNQLVPHSWHILYYEEDKKAYEPVGEYTLIETDEPIEITEKKLFNVVAILNHKDYRLLDFNKLTNQRVLFTMVPKTPESNVTKVVLRTYDGNGVSKENAVITFEKGVFDE
jgi:hypothetical protein